MKERLQQRLQVLQSEFDAGQKMLADLEAKQADLRQMLLRISGAIQVLEEVLSESSEKDMPLPDSSHSVDRYALSELSSKTEEFSEHLLSE